MDRLCHFRHLKVSVPLELQVCLIPAYAVHAQTAEHLEAGMFLTNQAGTVVVTGNTGHARKSISYFIRITGFTNHLQFIRYGLT